MLLNPDRTKKFTLSKFHKTCLAASYVGSTLMPSN